MTTPAAERLYLAQHLYLHEGRMPAIYNPNNSSFDELPVIYGFNNGGSRGWYSAVLLSQDGEFLGGHICSDEGYMPADLGIIEGARPDRHRLFREHYPEGYRMEFVPREQMEGHVAFNRACEASKKRAKEQS